jgi:hypothetical protein
VVALLRPARRPARRLRPRQAHGGLKGLGVRRVHRVRRLRHRRVVHQLLKAHGERAARPKQVPAPVAAKDEASAARHRLRPVRKQAPKARVAAVKAVARKVVAPKAVAAAVAADRAAAADRRWPS